MFALIGLTLTFGAGIEINAIQIGISYDLGLANISIYNDNGHKVNNRVLKFSVACWIPVSVTRMFFCDTLKSK